MRELGLRFHRTYHTCDFNVLTRSSSSGSKSVTVFPDTVRKSKVRQYNIFIWLCTMCSMYLVWSGQFLWLGQSRLPSFPGSPPSLASPLLRSYLGLGCPLCHFYSFFFLTATIIQTFNMSADTSSIHPICSVLSTLKCQQHMHKSDWHFSDTQLGSDWLYLAGSGRFLQANLQPQDGATDKGFLYSWPVSYSTVSS